MDTGRSYRAEFATGTKSGTKKAVTIGTRCIIKTSTWQNHLKKKVKNPRPLDFNKSAATVPHMSIVTNDWIVVLAGCAGEDANLVVVRDQCEAGFTRQPLS